MEHCKNGIIEGDVLNRLYPAIPTAVFNERVGVAVTV
jgi:hypothetical protein